MPTAPDRLSSALEGILLRFHTLVRSVARRRGVPDAEIDEVMQEMRIRLWRALESGERIEGANTSYVYQTAMSAACDVLRRHRSDRTQSLETVRETERQHMERAPGPDLAFEHRELALVIDRTLESLGPAQRPVVRMYLAGYAQAEIETLLGWTEAKTRNVLYRGLGTLREALASQGIQPGVTR